MNKFEKIKFVSIGGSNDTGDGSFELPYRTIQYAMSQVEIGELGWRVVLMSGSYYEPNLDLLPNIALQAMIPNTVTITSPIIFAYNGNYSFNGITPFITDNYAFTCTNNLSINITFTNCNLTAIPTTDAGCGIFNINNATFNISIIDSLLSIQNYQELVSIINTTTNSNGVISLNDCELKAIKNNQIQLDAPILLLNGNTKVIVENSKIYGQIQIENNASINANKTNLKTSQLPVVVTNSPTTSRITHCNIDCETNPVIDGLGTLQVAECCFLNNGTRFSTTLNNNTGIYYLPTTSPRLVDQALPQSIQSGALYYAQGDFYDDRTSRFRIPQADQTTGVISPDQLPDAEYGEKGVNFLISVRKGATKQSVIDLEAGNNMEIDTTDGVAIFNAEGQLTNKVLVELADGTTEAVSKLKQGSNMDWVIDGETVTQSATGGGESYEIGDGLQTTLNPDTGKEILSSKADATQFTYDETGATILTAEVQQDLAKGASSVQSVNNETPDIEGNVDIITDPYISGNGIDISEIDPETGKKTISTKVNASEFRYNDNGLMELSDQVINALAKADSSVQTVNQIPADAEGNVDVAGSLPVLTLVSSREDDIGLLQAWLLTQPSGQSTLHFITKNVPIIEYSVGLSDVAISWEYFCYRVTLGIKVLYPNLPNFLLSYRADGRIEVTTNDILNPIQMYTPSGDPELSINTKIKLTTLTGAEIVSQPYATIDQVNTIVNNAIIPLQQDIQLLNIDMFFADYYLGISINYLLSGKWTGDEASTYSEILAQLNDTNTLTFTLADDVGQYNYPLTITKQQFIDFTTLDNFSDYISAQMLAQYEITNFVVIFKELGSQGFLITNLDSNVGVLMCDQDNNNLAVIMKLTDLTGAKDRIYTEFSENSLQQQIIDNKLIINDVFINKINNGENVTIDVDPATNTATFSATGGSGGANKVTVSVNGANPVAYNVDGTGNIAINVPLTTSLTSNLLLVTTSSGKTNLQADVSNQLTINSTSKQLALSTAVTASLAKGDSALQDITTTNLLKGTKTNNILPLSAPIASNTQLGLAQADGSTITANNGILSSSGGGALNTNPTLTTELIATPKDTSYFNGNGTTWNTFGNWIASFKYINDLYSYPKLYVTRLNVGSKGSTSGGSYGVYQSYSPDSYNDLISGEGLTPSAIYSALTSTSSLTLSVIGKGQNILVSTPKNIFAGLADMTAVATILQTQMQKSSFIPNATCIWNGKNLVLSSGTLEWNFDLAQDWGVDCSNTIFRLVPNNTNNAGLIAPGGATLLPNSFGGWLNTIAFDAHDGSSNPAKLSKTYTPLGNQNTFTVEIYENGTFLPDVGQYAVLSYTVADSGLVSVNQNRTYNNRYMAIWDNTKINITPSAEINNVLACTMVNMKKASPYKNLYITAVGSSSGSLGNATIMLVPSLDYGCTNPIGQPIRVSQGGGNGVYEDEYCTVRFTWRFPNQPSPYNIYAGNAPAFTITNTPLNNIDANAQGYTVDATRLSKYPTKPYYETFTTTGLVDRALTGEIVSRLSSQVYNNNFFVASCKTMTIKPSTSVISSNGDFQVYLRFDKVNYTQCFKTTVVVPFPTGTNYTNCKFRLVFGNIVWVNGINTPNPYVDLPIPPTINGGQTLFLTFDIAYDEYSYMNINYSIDVQPRQLTSAEQQVGTYLGKSEGNSNLGLGLDSYISNFQISPEIGLCNGVNAEVQELNGYETYVFTFEGGRKYSLLFKGYIAFTGSYNSQNNPCLVGLINLTDSNNRIVFPVYQKIAFDKRHNINVNKETLILDLTDIPDPVQYRVIASTAIPQIGIWAIISDNITINIKELHE